MICIPVDALVIASALIAAAALMVYASPRAALSLADAITRCVMLAASELRIHAQATAAARAAKENIKREMRQRRAAAASLAAKAGA